MCDSQSASAATIRRASASFQPRESPGGYRLLRVRVKYFSRIVASRIDRSRNSVSRARELLTREGDQESDRGR